MIVAADGSGDFRTVQEALNQIPDDNRERAIIHIKTGIYKEKLHIEKPFVTLIGESAEHTILTYDDHAKKKLPNGDDFETFRSYSVFIGADDFTAEQLTFENAAGRGELVGQAVAAYVDGDRAAFRGCRFLGHQDTLFTAPLPPAPVKRALFGGPASWRRGGIRGSTTSSAISKGTSISFSVRRQRCSSAARFSRSGALAKRTPLSSRPAASTAG